MAKRMLVQYKRGSLKSSVYEEQLNNKAARMWVEVERQGEVLRSVEIPERDQDLAEMKLTDLMNDEYHKMHGKVAKKFYPNL